MHNKNQILNLPINFWYNLKRQKTFTLNCMTVDAGRELDVFESAKKKNQKDF